MREGGVAVGHFTQERSAAEHNAEGPGAAGQYLEGGGLLGGDPRGLGAGWFSAAPWLGPDLGAGPWREVASLPAMLVTLPLQCYGVIWLDLCVGRAGYSAGRRPPPLSPACPSGCQASPPRHAPSPRLRCQGPPPPALQTKAAPWTLGNGWSGSWRRGARRCCRRRGSCPAAQRPARRAERHCCHAQPNFDRLAEAFARFCKARWQGLPPWCRRGYCTRQSLSVACCHPRCLPRALLPFAWLA